MSKNLKAGKNIYEGLGIKVKNQQAPPPQQYGNPTGMNANDFDEGNISRSKIPTSNGGMMGGSRLPGRSPSGYPKTQNQSNYNQNYQPPQQQQYTPQNNYVASVLNTPETELLGTLSKLPQGNVGIDLNSHFAVKIVSGPVYFYKLTSLDQNYGPQQ